MKRFAALFLILAAAASAVASDFQIVVHAGNPIATIRRPLLRDYFMGRATRWIDGAPVKPVDLVQSSPVRAKFSQEVLGKDPAAVKSQWMSLLFAGRGTPPPEFDTEQKVLDAIRNTPTAIGYVSASTPLGSGVKAIEIADK